MRYPKRDQAFRDNLNRTASQTKIHVSKVEEVMEFYFNTISKLVEWDRDITVHIDYIGDLKFNQKWVNKVREMKAKQISDVA